MATPGDCDSEGDSELEDNTGLGPSSSKKQKIVSVKKFGGAAIYKTKYQAAWRDKWPFAVPIPRNPHSFQCNVCNKEVSCGPPRGKRLEASQ